MNIRLKNSIPQSCRFCQEGGAAYRVDSEEGTYYLCEDHRKTLIINEVEMASLPLSEKEPEPIEVKP